MTITDRPITHVRYLALAVPDLSKQAAFFQHDWGLTPVNNEDSVVHFAAEGSPEPFVIRTRQADERRIDVISFGAADAENVDALATRLSIAGTQMISEPDKLNSPSGGYGFRFFDLDGRTIEVSSDVQHRKHRKIEERESIPVRLSHVVVNSANPTATKNWYEKHMGFRLSDSLGDHMHFMRCSNLHHSFAIAHSRFASLNHVSFEMRGLDEYMRGTGRIMRTGRPVLWGPGRHLAGDNTFSYFLDPHGNTVEYTTALETIDEDTWHPHVYDLSQPEVADQWGTSGEIDDIVNNGKSMGVDPGLYVAPPI